MSYVIHSRGHWFKPTSSWRKDTSTPQNTACLQMTQRPRSRKKSPITAPTRYRITAITEATPMALFAARISSYRRVKPSGILMKWVTSVSLSPATTSRRRYLPSPSCRSGRS